MQEKKAREIIDKLNKKHNDLMLEMQEKSLTDDCYFIFNKYKLDECLKQIIEIYKLFEDSWHIKTKEEVTLFGIYLSCLVSEMLSNLNKVDVLNDSVSNKHVGDMVKDFISNGEKRLGIIKDEFSTFLSDFKSLNIDYLEWLDLMNTIENEQTRATIENIIRNIHYHLES